MRLILTLPNDFFRANWLSSLIGAVIYGMARGRRHGKGWEVQNGKDRGHRG